MPPKISIPSNTKHKLSDPCKTSGRGTWPTFSGPGWIKFCSANNHTIRIHYFLSLGPYWRSRNSNIETGTHKASPVGAIIPAPPHMNNALGCLWHCGFAGGFRHRRQRRSLHPDYRLSPSRVSVPGREPLQPIPAHPLRPLPGAQCAWSSNPAPQRFGSPRLFGVFFCRLLTVRLLVGWAHAAMCITPEPSGHGTLTCCVIYYPMICLRSHPDFPCSNQQKNILMSFPPFPHSALVFYKHGAGVGSDALRHPPYDSRS